MTLDNPGSLNENDRNEFMKEQLKKFSLLHYAASGGDTVIFTHILDQCQMLESELFDNKTNVTKETPLHWAVSCCHKDIVQIIVNKMKEIKDGKDLS